MATVELLSTQAAAEYLTHDLPYKTVEQWALWLRNNRNQARRAIYRVKSEQLGRIAVYTKDELASFVEFEKSRQLGKVKLSGRAAEVMRAFGIGEQTGGTQGRSFKGGSANPSVANVTGTVFVQTVIDEPLLVFAMTPEQAIEFGNELVEAGRAAKRINAEQLKGASNGS